jgi:hypothetical protein
VAPGKQPMKTDVLQMRIYRYLLSDLPQDEQSALEQEFLANDELFDQVWATENVLIDRYARGKLTPEEKDLFERNYLASPVHRERLEFAKTLVRAADSATEATSADFGPARPSKWWSSLVEGWNSNRLSWAMAATVLLFAASIVWLFAENRRLREQIYQAGPERAFEQRIKDLEKELSTQREQRDELAAELAALREEQPLTVGPQPNHADQTSVVSFLLSPMLMRGDGDPQELKIKDETTAVIFKMNVQEPNGRSYQVRLRTVDGAQIWSRSSLKARQQGKDGGIVSVSIPSNKIPKNDYILTLSAINSSNESEEINRYFFRVINQ